MQRLSGLDASFLYLETPTQVLHVCGLLVLDGSTMPGGYDFERFKEKLAERVALIPAFRRKLHNPLWNLTHPVWVEDEDFDLEAHVHRIGVPAPGDRRELAALCAHIAGQRLDRARPLWQLHVIEGLAGGEIAVLLKMHHASVDGVGGASLITALAGLEPDAPPPEVARDERRNAGVPGRRALLGAGLTSVVKGPVELAKLLPDLLGLAPKWIGKALQGKGMPVPFTAPRTSLNGTITAHRSVAYASLGLDEVKQVKNAFGVTVNDVALAVVSGALRQFLRERGELPDDPLVATVPVSVHGRTERDHGSNKVSAFFASLPTHLEDPAARVFTLAESNRLSKDHHYDIDADMLGDWAQFSAASMFGLAVRAYSALRLAERHPVVHNLVVSNVPGPPMPLYLLGCRITGLYPLGPVFHGAGLNVTVLSNAGRVDVGLLGARELTGDLWPLADHFPDALGELVEAARAQT
ncbi:WS/DGAT/MGAT family O-acyltransferase [Amycolatopsis regifaucium]|uniref:Diacylglycerol O-acyltransferase n=1 Tax=Amycolatopsis regifaucium TaxID=546365 RepID=A0A154MKQ5_9PSEU|nr:wax ester/triacylglycerol synthase family O-acyltransferase [Amycolatopsis regifaucium]KZB84467.1 diacylglycerol O-acyltransferase [Amycolatopsis regifaucium]OKA10930.1 diacylglycerol O-acyltransferase [Amycolatopsis regifaucium]SFI22402.1 acyltransferase, WS/DGAT/MGAT [Amycolatopsis regifaucium]